MHFFWRFYLNKNRRFLDKPLFFLTTLNPQLVKMRIPQKEMIFQEIKFQETDIYIKSSISSVVISCDFLMAKQFSD